MHTVRKENKIILLKSFSLSPSICLIFRIEHLCDGINHCIDASDERLCPIENSNKCIKDETLLKCSKLNFYDEFNEDLNALKTINEIEIKNSNLSNNFVKHLVNISFNWLIDFKILNTQIELENITILKNFPNLRYLDLSESLFFTKLPKLSQYSSQIWKINISFTNLLTLDDIFLNAKKTINLDLSFTKIREICSQCLSDLISLKYFNLSGTNVLKISSTAFQRLTNLYTFHTEQYKLCCFAKKISSLQFCSAKPSYFSTCADLIGIYLLRILIWFIAIISIIFNILSILLQYGYRSKSFSILTLSLSISDVFLGFYLLAIAIVDKQYRNTYIQNDEYWRPSIACEFLGILATFSLQTSQLLLFFITLERFLIISWTIKSFKKMKEHHLAKTAIAVLSFILSIIIAVFPVIVYNNNSEMGNEHFYSRSGVCLAIHLTNDKVEGWLLSFILTTIFNFLIPTLIVFLYVSLFKQIYDFRKSVTVKSKETIHHENMNLLKKVLPIVWTNILASLPIFFLSR